MTEPITPAGGTPAAAPTTTTTAAMQREIGRIRQEIRDLQAMQASGRLWVWGSTALIILMFAVFMYATYSRIRGNFGQAAMQTAIKEHGQELMPLTQAMIVSTGRDVLPAYKDAMMQVLHARGPAAAQAAVAQLKALPEQSGQEFQDKVKVAFDAAVRKIEPEFRAAYPKVSDERRQQIMATFVADQITKQNQRIASRVDQLYTNDLDHMQDVLQKYDLPDADPGPAGQQATERQFLHTMVALLDDRVDEAYAVPTADDAAVPVSSRSRPATRPATTGPAMP